MSPDDFCANPQCPLAAQDDWAHRRDPSPYPSSLFHFTDRAGLLGILTSNFKVRYCREHVRGKTQERHFGAPMVSFCDLRLSELVPHMRKYGRYGIGMSKKWADSKGLNPVYYISAHAGLTDNYINSIGDLYAGYQKITDGEEAGTALKTYSDLLDVYRYMKNYEGPLVIKGKTRSNSYRFADEREWRYVPDRASGSWPFLSIKLMDNKEYRERCESEFECLYFEPNDIRYIIVEFERERDEIIGHIREAKEKRYEPQDITRLASRVISAEQIWEDV